MSTRTASRALVAYFDHKLAARIVAHVLKNAPPEKSKAFAEAVLALIPKACETVLWELVKKRVAVAGEAFIAAPPFQKKVDAFVAGSCDVWIEEAAEAVIVERVQQQVERTVKVDYSTQLVQACSMTRRTKLSP